MGVDLSKLVFEPFFDDRLKVAIEKGKRAASGVVETPEDLEMKLRIQLSDHYGIPIMDPYFDRPVDQLLFEAVIISERAQAANNEGKITENELEDAAKFAAEGWDDETPAPALSDEEKQKMKDFMQTGKFVGE